MTYFADFADTHFAGDVEVIDFDEYEMPGDDDQTAWMDEYEYDMGAEDAYLDSYWENEAEMAFWDGEWS